MNIKALDALYINESGKPLQASHKQDSEKDLRLAKSCSDFEAVMLTTLWNSMTKTSGLDLGGWDVMMSQAMGKSWASSGGIGLAKVLYKQLSKASSSEPLGDDPVERTITTPEQE